MKQAYTGAFILTSTLVDASEKCAKNFKSPKNRVTLMATANASGDFKLPLVFIHKSCRPRCFSGVNMSLPVHNYSQKSGWMDKVIFTDWFHKHFVPTVKQYLQSKSLCPQHSSSTIMLHPIHPHPHWFLLMAKLSVYSYHQMSLTWYNQWIRVCLKISSVDIRGIF